MTVSQLALQHTRAKVNESASDIRLSIIMLNHEHPPAGNERRKKNGAIKPKSESLLFKTSISALKPFTFPRRSAHLYMNGLLSCRRPLNSSMAVSWGLYRSYEWDRRPWKTHSRLCAALICLQQSAEKRDGSIYQLVNCQLLFGVCICSSPLDLFIYHKICVRGLTHRKTCQDTHKTSSVKTVNTSLDTTFIRKKAGAIDAVFSQSQFCFHDGKLEESACPLKIT